MLTTSENYFWENYFSQKQFSQNHQIMMNSFLLKGRDEQKRIDLLEKGVGGCDKAIWRREND